MSINVNGDSGNISEEETEIFNHETLPGGLWSSHASFVIAASRDHVTGDGRGDPADHLSSFQQKSICLAAIMFWTHGIL
jgi:hypothetical protein